MIMGNEYLLFLFWCLCLTNGHFFNKHDFLMKQFRKSENSVLLSRKRDYNREQSGAVSYQSDLRTSCYLEEHNWIIQPLDHFNEKDKRIWYQRYFENLNKWRQGGPILIYIGGEGELDNSALCNGIIYDLAVETHGAMFAVEHRYYGQSQPFSPVVTSDLKYLSTRQALADLANFIKDRKQRKHFRDMKVVVVGGSYAGNLAVWMRLLYSDLVDAAIASSAPVLAKLDFSEYYETVSYDLENYSNPECFDEITNISTYLRDVFNNQSEIKELRNKFNICNESDISIQKNQELFSFHLFSNLADLTQYGNFENINYFCKYIPRFMDGQCFYSDVYSNFFFNNLTDIFSYQMCNELGYFATSPQRPPFGDLLPDIDFWINSCRITFGDQFTKAYIDAAIKRTNAMYGGLRPNVTNVFFSNGELDPWAKLGVLTDLSDAAPARVIKGASHCSDVIASDTPEVINVQEEAKYYIKKWIGYK